MKILRLAGFLPLCYLLLNAISLKAQTVVPLQQGKATSIRGLSVVNDNVAWISGSRGNIAITVDGGKTWNWSQVKGFEKSDFRDIEAFSAKEAVIMSSGTPAVILKTKDGGKNWQLKYKNTDTTYFLDAMDFAGKKHGVVLGDPINNKFLLLETNDSGETWQPLANPPTANTGEAAFAASGTCLRITAKTIDIVTGGTSANYIHSAAPYTNWFTDGLPIVYGKASQGIFSMSDDGLVFVGGDYVNNKETSGTACWFDPMAFSIKSGYRESSIPSGYQSCVEAISHGFYLSTGTSGTNLSNDGGKTWRKIDDASYNVCRKAKHGNWVLLAGDGGKIGVFKL